MGAAKMNLQPGAKGLEVQAGFQSWPGVDSGVTPGKSGLAQPRFLTCKMGIIIVMA